MKNILITITAVTFVLLTACKKTDAPVGGNPNANNNVTATGDPYGTFSGLFVEAGGPTGVTEAAFYNTPQALHLSTLNPSTPNGTVTAVYCNNVKFSGPPTSIVYRDSTQTVTYPPAVWSVVGNANFPSFTYTCTMAMPTYNNGASLPVVINRNQNLTIPTTGAANYDQIIMQIYDASTHKTSKLAASSSAASLTCVKDSLLKLSPTFSGSITVDLYKYNTQVLAGKNYLFISILNYSKSNVVIQ